MNLKIQNLRYAAGKLDMRIDVEFHSRIAGIFGPSGSGKTTLLELLAGFRKPHTGTIHFKGKTLNDFEQGYFLPSYERNIGYVPQDLALFPHLSVAANLRYGWNFRKDSESLDYTRTVRLLELEPLLARSILLLSGGEKQRVAFARAVLASPDLLLMDEPLSSLNRELKSKIKGLILTIRDEFRIPILFVSHDADDMMLLCDQVVILENGKNIRSGRPDSLFVPDDATHYNLAQASRESNDPGYSNS